MGWAGEFPCRSRATQPFSIRWRRSSSSSRDHPSQLLEEARFGEVAGPWLVAVPAELDKMAEQDLPVQFLKERVRGIGPSIDADRADHRRSDAHPEDQGLIPGRCPGGIDSDAGGGARGEAAHAAVAAPASSRCHWATARNPLDAPSTAVPVGFRIQHCM